jgi:hypothetical protein
LTHGERVHAGIHFPFISKISPKGDIDRGTWMKGDELMEIKLLTEQQKRALAEISVGIYGEELTRIMLPELKNFLQGASKKDEFAEISADD